MDVNIITDNGHMKGATLKLRPIELLLIQSALMDYAENVERYLRDRKNAERMWKKIDFTVFQAGRGSE